MAPVNITSQYGLYFTCTDKQQRKPVPWNASVIFDQWYSTNEPYNWHSQLNYPSQKLFFISPLRQAFLTEWKLSNEVKSRQKARISLDQATMKNHEPTQAEQVHSRVWFCIIHQSYSGQRFVMSVRRNSSLLRRTDFLSRFLVELSRKWKDRFWVHKFWIWQVIYWIEKCGFDNTCCVPP